MDGEEHAVPFPVVPAAAQPVFGEPLEPSQNIIVGMIPIFVEYAP
jgi:hypothetical protein